MTEDFAPSTVTKYVVPRAILVDSVAELRRRSAGRIEAVVLWQGRQLDRDVAEVRHLIVPRQIAGALHFNVPLEERLRLIDVVSAAGDIILAQLHTHPREAFHSAVDDRLAIPQHVGGISIVVADFAAHWDGDLTETSVNRHLGRAAWEELSPRAVSALFDIK